MYTHIYIYIYILHIIYIYILESSGRASRGLDSFAFYSTWHQPSAQAYPSLSLNSFQCWTIFSWEASHLPDLQAMFFLKHPRRCKKKAPPPRKHLIIPFRMLNWNRLSQTSVLVIHTIIVAAHLQRYLCEGKKGSLFEPPTHTRDVPTIIVAAPLHQDLYKTENPFLTLLAS